MTDNDVEAAGTQAPARKPVEQRTENRLALPPESKWMQRFSTVIFFLIGTGLTAFVLLNPLSIPFLPDLRGGGEQIAPPVAESGAEQGRVLYQCPMHPEVIESEPGNCPICQMKLMPIEGGTESPAGSEVPKPAVSGAGGEREILYYYAPMDPTYMSNEPGLSPMGMKLVPKYKDEQEGGAGSDGVVRIDPTQVQNIGVVSEPVRRIDLTRIVRTVGILDFNAEHVFWVNMKYSGWIEKVYINYAGQEISEGDPLFEIYSPELVTTQEEYLRALDYRRSLAGSARPEIKRQADDLLASTRGRLGYWDISEKQVSELEQTQRVLRTLKVTSPVDGVVVEVMDEALEGMFVKPGMNLYKLADLSSIWVHVDAYESDLAGIRVGQPADVQLTYFPGQTFQGRVLFLQPELNQKTRTVKVCVELPNRDLLLKPGMYANVRIKGLGVKNAVAVSDSAILRSGERNIVFVDLGEGRFSPQNVEVGMTGQEGLVEIRQGLAGGESVVVQAQFMLDSESRVQEAIRKFLGAGKPPGETAPPGSTPEPPASGHQH